MKSVIESFCQRQIWSSSRFTSIRTFASTFVHSDHLLDFRLEKTKRKVAFQREFFQNLKEEEKTQRRTQSRDSRVRDESSKLLKKEKKRKKIAKMQPRCSSKRKKRKMSSKIPRKDLTSLLFLFTGALETHSRAISPTCNQLARWRSCSFAPPVGIVH